MAILWPSDYPSTIHGDAAPHPKQPYFLLSSRARRLINCIDWCVLGAIVVALVCAGATAKLLFWAVKAAVRAL